jgi:hypothetical protein
MRDEGWYGIFNLGSFVDAILMGFDWFFIFIFMYSKMNSLFFKFYFKMMSRVYFIFFIFHIW